VTPHVVQARGGSLTIADAALEQIVIGAAESVDGARVRRPRRGLDVGVEGGAAHVELELAAPFGSVLPELGKAVQEAVREALEGMCGLRATAVDVAIEELE
jgi:uncharacterized alkaline shock family protein YloU